MNARVVTIERAALIVVTGIVFEHDAQFEAQLAGVVVRGYYNPRTAELLVEAPVPNNQVKLFEEQITHKHSSKVHILEILKEIENEIDVIWNTHERQVETQFSSSKAEESLWW